MKQKISLAVVFFMLIMVVYNTFPPNDVLHNKVFAADEKQSTIAGIVVDGMNRQEISQLLQQEIDRWIAEEITITGGGKTVNIDATSLQFDIANSIDRYEMATKKPWYAFWKKSPVAQIPVSVLLTEEVSRQITQVPQWNYEETSNNVIAQASYLKSHEVEAVINELTDEISREVLAAIVEPMPKDAVGVEEIIAPFADYTWMSHAEFSYLELLDGQEQLANEAGLNFVASMLYGVALQANSEIIERHSQHVIPAYLGPGIEAAVEKNGSKNLRFVNALDEAIQLQFVVEGDNVKLEAYATNLVAPATLRIAREKAIKPRMITRYSNDLAVGRQRVIEQGKEGVRVIVYRSHPEKGEELVTRDYYAPINKVILKSARTPEPAPEMAPQPQQQYPQYIPPTSQNVGSDYGGAGVGGSIGSGSNSNLSQDLTARPTPFPSAENGTSSGTSTESPVKTKPMDKSAGDQKMDKSNKMTPQ